MIKLVFSYSHKDEELRDQLEIHLALLKRQKVIEVVESNERKQKDRAI